MDTFRITPFRKACTGYPLLVSLVDYQWLSTAFILLPFYILGYPRYFPIVYPLVPQAYPHLFEHGAQLVYLLSEAHVVLEIVLHFEAGVYDGGVVFAAELLADERV